MKIKSKIRYLGERNSILPGQMAEQLSVEVDVKNVTYTQTHRHTDRRTRADICFRITLIFVVNINIKKNDSIPTQKW